MILFPIVMIIIVAIAWGLIVLVHKANVSFGDEKSKTEGTTFGGCVTFIIIVAAVLALCYFWDALGGGYDYNGPIRRP